MRMLDKIDRKLIELLQSNARISVKKLAQEVFLSAPAVSARLERLEKLKERLPRSFHQCHKSYLVNMDCIRHIRQQSILLKTGEELPVSKARYAETRAAFFRYMGETL